LRRSFECASLSFQQRLTLNFELHDTPLDFVNLHGQGIDLHAQARRRFVDQVDGLSGRESGLKYNDWKAWLPRESPHP